MSKTLLPIEPGAHAASGRSGAAAPSPVVSGAAAPGPVVRARAGARGLAGRALALSLLAVAALPVPGTAAAQTARDPTVGAPLMKPPLPAVPAPAAARDASSAAAARPAAAAAATPAPAATATPPAAAAAVRPGVPGAPRTIAWEALVPPNWDPFKDFKGLNFQAMDDGDPRAAQLLKQMREAWDNAPVNTALAGQTVRLPGFVVPLEEGPDGVREFLLVPYFGACIHSPPPPANQIVHVLPRTPAKGFKSMDTVWVTGALSTVRTDSYLGAAGWRIDAVQVAPYTAPVPAATK